MRQTTKRRSHPALVLLTCEEGVDAPMGALTSLVAESLARDFGDAVLLLRIADADAADLPAGIVREPGRGDVLWMRAEGGRDATIDALHAKARELTARYAYIFVDASRATRAGDDLTRQMVSELGRDLEREGELVPRLVVLTKSRKNPETRGGWYALRTDLLEPQVKTSGDTAGMADGLLEGLRRASSIAAAEGARALGKPREPRGEYYPSSRVPEWCRARLDLASIAALDAGSTSRPSLADVDDETRASLSRWGRAITDRRVGLALGGSGAWGYAHVALMEELHDSGVPIDIIAGSSSGTLMGSYYAALGRQGLDLLVERGKTFSRAVWFAAVSSATMDLAVQLDLGPLPLEALEVVLLPVATNLSTGRPEVIREATVGFGVRASGSAPGLFAPTIAQGAQYVDGAITDNMPILLVERMGADLTVACNPLPPPAALRVDPPKSALGAILKGFNPVSRVLDFTLSFSLMCHDAGDCEPREDRIVYDPPSAEMPLFGTFDFERASEIMEAVRKQRAFKETVRRAQKAWKRIAAARGSRGEA